MNHTFCNMFLVHDCVWCREALCESSPLVVPSSACKCVEKLRLRDSHVQP